MIGLWSRLRAIPSAIVGGVAIIGAAFALWRHGEASGERVAEAKAKDADRRRADGVREKAADALRRSSGDDRAVDDRLREHGRLRD
jgi:hypothetical protein